MATGTVSVPLPLPALYSDPQGKVLRPFIFVPHPLFTPVSDPSSPERKPSERRKMGPWEFLRNVGSFFLCRVMERLLGLLAFS